MLRGRGTQPSFQTIRHSSARGSHYTQYTQSLYNLWTFYTVRTVTKCAPDVRIKNRSDVKNQVCADKPSSTTSDLLSNYLKQICLYLRHDPKRAIIEYLWSAGRSSSGVIQILDNVLKLYRCSLGNRPKPHTFVSTTPPSAQKHRKSQIHMVLLDSTDFLNIFDLASPWSKGGRLWSRSMSSECSPSTGSWIYRHGNSKLLHADNDYDIAKFRIFCDGWTGHLILVAVMHHKANRITERAC